jgi:hypothetical protein
VGIKPSQRSTPCPGLACPPALGKNFLRLVSMATNYGYGYGYVSIIDSEPDKS